jgi:hypothetical protein
MLFAYALFMFAAGYLIGRERRRPHTPQQPPLDLRVIEVWGGRDTMDPIERPPLNLLDSQGTTLFVNTKDAGGEQLPDDQFTWSLTPDDGSVATLATERVNKAGETVAAPAGARFLINTHPGSVVVKVVSSAGGASREETMPVTIDFSAPGELGLSAGEPFED